MKRGMAVVVAVLLALVLSVVPVAAQQAPSGKPSIPGETQGMPGGGMQGMPGGAQGMMGNTMICPMMMSMMGRQADPRVMQMHGEMMKAMGEIMMKHGKMLEGGGTR
jgi:hypothetical protein